MKDKNETDGYGPLVSSGLLILLFKSIFTDKFLVSL